MTMLNETDLDGSVELIGFMWLVTGREAATLTPDTLLLLRTIIGQGFDRLPADVQELFAHGAANNRHIQERFAAATIVEKLSMVQQYRALMDVLVGPVAGAQTGAGGELSLNAQIAQGIAWKASGAGDWHSR